MNQPVNDRPTCSLLSGLGFPSKPVLESPRNGLSSQHLVGGGPATPNDKAPRRFMKGLLLSIAHRDAFITAPKNPMAEPSF
jgi:hypothetical protein